MTGQLQQQIMSDLQTLNPFQLTEVVDFIGYLKTKPPQRLRNPEIIDALCGKYPQLSSSDEFARHKQDEMILEGEKWQRR